MLYLEDYLESMKNRAHFNHQYALNINIGYLAIHSDRAPSSRVEGPIH